MRVGIIGYGSMGKMLLWKFSEAGNIDKQEFDIFFCTFQKFFTTVHDQLVIAFDDILLIDIDVGKAVLIVMLDRAQRTMAETGRRAHK